MVGERISLVISSLGGGGAERILVWLANHWSAAGRKVCVISLAAADEPVAYRLRPEVELQSLGMLATANHRWHALRNNLLRLSVLRQTIRKQRPDLVVSFMDRTNIRVLLALVGCRFPVIVTEHTNPDYLTGTVWRGLRRLLYPYAQAVVVLTARTGEMLKCPSARLRVIPNPVSPPESSTARPAVAVHRPSLVAVGRLVEMKRFALLLEIFAELQQRFPQWHLLLLGEGPDRSRLEHLAEQLGIADKVCMPGYVENPQLLVRECELFVLTSRFEGFPMALCEALACGVPAVSVDCPTGPREILRPEVDGLLVPVEDRSALRQALLRLMADAPLRKQMATRAVEICGRFSEQQILQLWEQLFAELQNETVENSGSGR